MAHRVAQLVEADTAGTRPVLTLLAESSGLRHMEFAGAKEIIDQYQEQFPVIESCYVANTTGEQVARTGTGELASFRLFFRPTTPMIAPSTINRISVRFMVFPLSVFYKSV